MKVIKKGKIPEEVAVRVTCGHCKTIFEYDKKDVKWDNEDTIGSRQCCYVLCPICTKAIGVVR